MSSSSALDLGQLFLLELAEDKWSRALETTLRTFQPSGVVVSTKIIRSVETARLLLQRISKVLGGDCFLGLSAHRFRPDPLGVLFSVALPPPLHVAAKGIKALGTLAKLRASTLSLVGFNVDFSLSLDLMLPGCVPELASFSLGRDPAVVTACGNAYLQALQQQNVLACGGRFPGLGSVQGGAKGQLPLSSKTMVALWREDLLPFRELLPRLHMLGISSASYQAYDFDVPCPAMLSTNVVTGLLRAKLGYESVAIANLPALARAWQGLEPSEAAVKALAAGCDLLILAEEKKNLELATQSVSNALSSGRLSSDRLNESRARVRAVKRLLKTRELADIPRTVQSLARQFRESRKEFES